VVRFQGARQRMQNEPARSLAVIALESGYHDQAHMTRDFVALAGTPPGFWRTRWASAGDAFMQDEDGRSG
jgi:transcriptional regulator GlxA family with amidase domain